MTRVPRSATEALAALRRQVRRLPPTLVDAALAAVLFAIVLNEALRDTTVPTPPHRAMDDLGYVLVAATFAPLAFRRRLPLFTFLAVGLPAATYAALRFPAYRLEFATLLAVYTAGSLLEGRRRVASVTLLLAGISAEYLLAFATGVHIATLDLVSTYLVYLAAWALGDNMRRRRIHVADLQARAVQLEREREERARNAATQERLRIAREMHDVVAHTLSVILVQSASAAHRPPPTSEVQAVFESIEAAARDAMDEMRGLLGVLREGGTTAERTPQPGIECLDVLVGQLRAAGVDVDVRHEGAASPQPLGANVSLAAYRVVQEALTNTLKHAGASRARVRLRWSAEHLELEVDDDGSTDAAGRAGVEAGIGSTASGGFGLAGMRERVVGVGGTFEAGEVPGGGFRVLARLPVAGQGGR